MQKIIELEKIYYEDKKTLLGYIGAIIDTGEIKYYSLFDKNGNYNPLKLTEFDKACPNHIMIAEVFKKHEIRPKFSTSLPQNLIEIIPKIIEKYHIYNEINNLSNQNLDNNSRILSVQHDPSPYFGFSMRKTNATYNPISYTIKLYDSDKSNLIAKENSLIHEIGHMKASECIIENNKLFVKCGFSVDIYSLIPYFLENGDTFYEICNLISQNDFNKRVLEEIINDQECRSAFSTFSGSYPNFGERLNILCNGELNKAREIHDIEVYYDNMCSIINDRNMALELLEILNTSVHSYSIWDRKSLEQEANVLIKKYEHIKNNRL